MNVISFSLWGNIDKYTIGAVENAKLAKIFYPGWKCVFYIGNDVPKHIINELIVLDCDIHYMGYGDWSNATLWRFLPASDENVDILISRDTDSRLSEREKIAVDEWLSSDKNFHIIRDHPYHGGHLIMAGMWGVRNNKLLNMKILIDNYNKIMNKYNDQIFLTNFVYPLIKDDCFIHDEFHSVLGVFPDLVEEHHEIKHKRNYEYIGEYYDENNNKEQTNLIDIIENRKK